MTMGNMLVTTYLRKSHGTQFAHVDTIHKIVQEIIDEIENEICWGQDTQGISRHQLVSHSGGLATQASGQALSQVVHHDLSLLLLLHATLPRSTSLPTRPLGKDIERLDATKYTYPNRDRQDLGTDAIPVPLCRQDNTARK
jgi:hypothetical protein